MLCAEGGERGEGVGDAQEGGGVVADLEVRGALGYELVGVRDMCVGFWVLFGENATGRTAAGSSSRSILTDVSVSRRLLELFYYV